MAKLNYRDERGFALIELLGVILLLSTVFAIGGISNLRSRSHQAARLKAQQSALPSVAKAIVSGENSLYQKYGHYSLNPVLDVYPLRPALVKAVNKDKFKISVTDNSSLPGQTILVSIRVPAVAAFGDSSTFQLALREGTATPVGCQGLASLGCQDGQWSLSH